MRKFLLLGVMFLGGCSDIVGDFMPPPPLPTHGEWTKKARVDCDGPFQEYSREISISNMPYRINTSVKVRCRNDGRWEGPYIFEGE
jgi:hypothetical protein